MANAAIGVGGMFHRQSAEQFGEVLEINLHGSIRLARAAMAVMRPANYGRIILVSSTGGLHGDIGLSAYAASKGGLLAFGRSLAAEGAGRGVLTNMLLPYALTQMTDDGMPSQVKAQLDPAAVAPVLTALASEGCRLNGEYIVTGGGRLRRASVVEWGTVELPGDPDLSPAELADLLAESHQGEPREFGVSVDAFADLMDGADRTHGPTGRPGELGAAAGEPGGVRGDGRLSMLATFLYAMRTKVHATMDTVWPLGFVLIAAVSFGLSAGHGASDGGCWCWR